MEVYAAQIDRMDQGIGRILDSLKEIRQWENTLIVFLSDNGGCAEEFEWVAQDDLKDWAVNRRSGTMKTRDGREVQYGNSPNLMPGGEETYQSYGVPWANVSNAPFRRYKRWVHEGGIATPFIVHWPAGIGAKGELRHQPAQLPDVMATLLDVVGIDYPESYGGRTIKPLEGFSMVPTFANQSHIRPVLYWEHEGNSAVRKGKWKLVCEYPGVWELYDMESDRTEMHDLSAVQPDVVRELTQLYELWAEGCNVLPWKRLGEIRGQRK
jgi:arylsulfatase